MTEPFAHGFVPNGLLIFMTLGELLMCSSHDFSHHSSLSFYVVFMRKKIAWDDSAKSFVVQKKVTAPLYVYDVDDDGHKLG